MAATAAGLIHLISFPKKVQVHFGQDNFKDIKESYFDFQNAIKKEKRITCNPKYGIKGIVAEWYNPNDKTVKWFNGGAPQFITPLNVRDMKTLGIITEIE